MVSRNQIACVLAGILLASVPHSPVLDACCVSYPSGMPVVNADQTVIILWDAATKTQHFIRQASFKSAAADFGFLIPTPSRPELDESGDEAFSHLRNLTEPDVVEKSKPWGGIGIGCGMSPSALPTKSAVTVLEEKRVAGFNAVVLQAQSADALAQWLGDHHYSFSPEVKAWAAPYIAKGWNITALKVAKDQAATDSADAAPADASSEQGKNKVSAAALRMSFKTDQPLFPYRESDSTADAAALGAKRRLLRIYFLSDARYEGSLGAGKMWSGNTAWAGPLTMADRSRVLGLLKLPETTGPTQWWLTEFEDDWAYQPAPADVTFSISRKQTEIKRPPIIHYTSNGWQMPHDVTLYALFAVVAIPPLVMRWRRRGRA
ncbi:MAG: DUF2330 domain-containing protein [Planctomycetes bacterium]|nr:DUF2330 domain-containing protein [Planctomycetota bacterium]